jgi:branched-chain amino acid transport system permease protein
VAIREDEVAAESVGINPLKYKVMAFAVGAASGGFGGVLSAGLVGIYQPEPLHLSDLGERAGAGDLWRHGLHLGRGASGAIVLQTVTSYLDNYQPWGYQINDLYMYIGALLIIMMIFRPAGLLPSRRRAASSRWPRVAKRFTPTKSLGRDSRE